MSRALKASSLVGHPVQNCMLKVIEPPLHWQVMKYHPVICVFTCKQQECKSHSRSRMGKGFRFNLSMQVILKQPQTCSSLMENVGESWATDKHPLHVQFQQLPTVIQQSDPPAETTLGLISMFLTGGFKHTIYIKLTIILNVLPTGTNLKSNSLLWLFSNPGCSIHKNCFQVIV